MYFYMVSITERGCCLNKSDYQGHFPTSFIKHTVSWNLVVGMA